MRIRRPKLAVIAAILVLPAASALGQARDEKQGMPVGVPIKMEKMDVSPALRNIQPIPPQRALNAPENPKVKVIKSPVEGFLAGADQAVQSSPGTREMPATTVNFEGVGNVNGVLPPDTQGDIGPNHYVQWVNLSFAIYNRAGTVVFGPAAGNTIWSGFGGACQSENAGDPITLYDPLSQRWVMSQFTSGSAPYKLCVAVSTTNDPTGTWNRYAFDWPANKFPDYPKWGVWPNSYFVTVNQFVGNSWGGAGVAAFEKDKMVLGQPARAVYYDLLSANSNFGGMLPADLDGASPPPAAAPGVFVEVDDSSYLPPNDAIRIWYFTVDWSVSPTPTSSFGLSGQPNETLTVSNFNLMPCTIAQTRTCIDQPTATTTQKLDAIGDRAMYRAAYRNFSGDQRLVFNHTVDAGSGRAGVRWYELQKTGATWAVRQQGTYAPADTLHRWMGSISQDGQGNIALGYSTSGAGAGQFPSIAITGKLGADPADGSMTQAESVIMAGTGAQTHSAARWGDYSMMGIDPADDCTFWYTTEYVQTTGSAPWQTRVAAFKYPGCAASTGTITGTVKNAATNAAIVGASVTIPGGFSTFTDGTGTYSIVVPSSATYNVTATAAGYSSATLSSGNVGAGATVTVNFLLNGVAVIGSTTFTQTAESCIPANSTPDPGETVTYSLCLANTGNANTANLVVNLQAGGGVVAGSSQNYGVVTAAGPAVCRDFTFQVSPGVLCTAAVTATFTLADGATTFPNVVRTLTTGAQAVTGAESFDTVTAPALPPGWTTTASGPGAAGWVTSTNAGGFTSNTSPNFAFIDDPAGVSDKSIYSPVINLPAGSNTLSFYHRYAFETPAYDGGVLEIAIGSANVLSNTYQDIVAAGGVFTLNGYSGTISSSFGNPLGGRQAFIGTTSGLYRNTTLTMPPAAGGQPIKLRWRMGSDSTTASTGWAIDTITLPGLPAGPITCACAVPILGATTFTQQTGESCTAPSNGVPDPGETVTYSLCIQNTGGAGTTNLVATLQAGGGVVAGSSQNYGAVAAAATVCRDFTFQVSNALTCGQQVTATFTLADGAATYPNIVRTLNTGVTSQSGPTAFANTTPITIPGAVAGGIQSANPFPSSIVVSGLTGMVSKVTVSLNGYAHAWSADVDMLLVGPAGQKVIIMSDAGPSGNQASVSFTLDDAAASAIPSGSITNGASYKPTNSGAGDTFNTAPPGPYGAALSDFIGTNPNGTWSLYIVDDFGSLDNGSLATGWAINITTSVTTCCVTVTNQAPTVTPTPGGITVPRGATTNLQIATVTDTDTAPPTLVFSVPSATAGLLLSNFVLSPTVANTWAVTADVFASCTALPTGETATLQAYDGTNTVQATLNVNTTANAAGATLTGGATLCAGEST
ncbi:MAG: carboxypeptidase-like regulatory domain-containing protein, partial [Thermoanaerobaculia bacterium]|nr:carboxypeptidase-like regulatory domain-containing protein [Thermoanaerobaculia bacterium]